MEDQHDPRDFRHYAKVDADGNLLAIVEVVSTVVNPDPDHFVDVTEQIPYTPDELQTTIQDTLQAISIATLNGRPEKT